MWQPVKFASDGRSDLYRVALSVCIHRPNTPRFMLKTVCQWDDFRRIWKDEYPHYRPVLPEYRDYGAFMSRTESKS